MPAGLYYPQRRHSCVFKSHNRADEALNHRALARAGHQVQQAKADDLVLMSDYAALVGPSLEARAVEPVPEMVGDQSKAVFLVCASRIRWTPCALSMAHFDQQTEQARESLLRSRSRSPR
jgi:hypothetical protein